MLCVSYAKGSNKGSTEAPLLSNWIIGTAFITTATGPNERLSKMNYWSTPLVFKLNSGSEAMFFLHRI